VDVVPLDVLRVAEGLDDGFGVGEHPLGPAVGSKSSRVGDPGLDLSISGQLHHTVGSVFGGMIQVSVPPPLIESLIF